MENHSNPISGKAFRWSGKSSMKRTGSALKFTARRGKDPYIFMNSLMQVDLKWHFKFNRYNGKEGLAFFRNEVLSPQLRKLDKVTVCRPTESRRAYYLSTICDCSRERLPPVTHSGHLNFFLRVTLIGALPVKLLIKKFIAMSSQFMWLSTKFFTPAGILKW